MLFLNTVRFSPFHCIIGLTLIGVVALSVWQGQYNLDPHHWGLMLSNAKDLFEGKLPYKVIFIQYGIFTTLIHVFAYIFLGGNLISLILITAVFYAIGLWFFFLLANYITKNSLLASLVALTAVMLHPIVIYPWSNYIAFPFLMVGLYYAIKYPTQLTIRIFAGASFGIAILCREGLAPAVVILTCSFFIIDCYVSLTNCHTRLKAGINSLVGLLLPISIFIAYLKTAELFEDWYTLAWELPKIYATTAFSHISGLNILNPLVTTLFNGVKSLNVYFTIFVILILVNIISIFVYIFHINKKPSSAPHLKVSIFSLLLVSSALHLTEIFRLSTGSIVGLIGLYVALKYIKIEYIFFVISSIFLLINLANPSGGNYFFPTKIIREQTERVHSPQYFHNQRWKKNAVDYYGNIERDLSVIKNNRCGIDFHFNYTMDVFLQILSPFQQYQIAPFYTSDAISALRHNFMPFGEYAKNNRIVIMQLIQNVHRDVFRPPENYYIYKKYYAPDVVSIPEAHTLLIMIPTDCRPL